MKGHLHTIGRALAVVAGIALLVLAVGWTDATLSRQLARAAPAPELIYLPPTPVLRAASLGFEHALADVLWFRTISYFGRHYRSDRVYPWLAGMCQAVTDLDPSAEHVYRFGGLILPWEAEHIDEGIALLEKGVRNLPDSWDLRYILGFSYYFFKNDLEAASRTLRAAAMLRGAPEFLSQLAALVYAAHEGPQRAIDFLAEIDRSSVNGEMRGIIRQRIRELQLSTDIDQLESAVQEYAARFHRLPVKLEELVVAGVLASIPREPFGGDYVLVEGSGDVQSSLGRKPWRLGSSKTRQTLLQRRHFEDNDEPDSRAD